MTLCYKCNKSILLLHFTCYGCQNQFCVKCRLPEDHICTHLDIIKNKASASLSNKLYNEVYLSDKLKKFE
jgi:predicted nucleic acid binding AN1-type Zn finger protein